ncbi:MULTISPECIES: DoxX family protein [Pontibacillus]|uniref:DoxX family protein n=1 Tax=Pontibacillus chungwhensis TaxID=265426 RepID=A0ABY8V370_9BACI|nr:MULTISPECIES: DoxX family protein [Pontibacillus]MCD5322416.1 DoxX family protein [Pontibacillus sp. HN14]WIF99702.1 DoxX family protein [Pontibacillus chungwhensis]
MKHKHQQLGVLFLRLFLGFTVFIHGLTKFKIGMGNTSIALETLTIPMSLLYSIGVIEVMGGILLMIGFKVRVVASVVAVLMLLSITQLKLTIGFLGNSQMAGFELDLALLSIAAFLALDGKTPFAIENITFQADECYECPEV